jgi:hypothetical protein
MGTDWGPDTTAAVLGEWVRFGAARHSHFLRPSAVAAAVMAAVTTPPGSHLPMIEVQPEAPVTPDPVTPDAVTPDPVTPDAVTPDPVSPGGTP